MTIGCPRARRVSVGVQRALQAARRGRLRPGDEEQRITEQYLTKLTIAPTISSGAGLLTRPELRLFFTWALWNEAARTATIDSGMLFTNTIYLSGSTFGVQAETWW